jgi:glycosyltransferase involved in cell wall biosynthesis
MNSEIITVGIPYYNSCKRLITCLSSIASQTLHPAEVVIVDDGSETLPDSAVDIFRDILNIRVVRHLVNKGVGPARNTILDECKTEYLTMIDSDDRFIDNMAIQHMDTVVARGNAIMLVTGFVEQFKDLSYSSARNDGAWVFGKVFSVAALREKNIRFLPQRTHEEAYVIRCIYASFPNAVIHENFATYLWEYCEGSITRLPERDYLFENFTDYVNGCLEASRYMYSNNLDSAVNYSVDYAVCMYTYLAAFKLKYPKSEKIREYEKLITDVIRETTTIKDWDMSYALIESYLWNIQQAIQTIGPYMPSESIFDFVRNTVFKQKKFLRW